MEIKKLKKYTANFNRFLLVSTCVAASLVAPKAQATGGDEECENMGCNSFFAPEIIENNDEAPFFRTWRTFYGNNDERSARLGTIQAINLSEWFSYYGWRVGESQLGYLLYKMSLPDLENLILATDGRRASLSAQAQEIKKSLDAFVANPDRDLDSASRKKRVSASLAYLRFAKQVEPLATRRLDYDAWDGSTATVPPEDAAVAKKLIDSAEALIRSTTEKSLINRYRLQVIRLYYYSARYDEAVKYYDANLASYTGTERDSTKYRFMDYGAGSLYKSKKYGRANYIYSLIYDQFLPMKRTSYFSFHPVEQSDWNETLALAKSTHEQEVLWQILGIYADGNTAIEKIFALNPASELLPLLLVREVNIAEENWSANQERINYPGDNSNNVVDGIKSDLETMTVKRLNTIAAIADSGKAAKPYLWFLSLGHLYTLANDLPNANKYLRLASRSLPTRHPIVAAQIRMSSLFAKIRSLTAVDAGMENQLAVELAWIGSYQSEINYRATTLNVWILAQLSRLYQDKGDVLRSLLLTDNPRSAFYRDNSKIDTMIALLTQPATAFDSYLETYTEYTVEQLQELKGLNLLYAGRLSESIQSFELVGDEIYKQELNADPFMIHIWDCHDCDFEAPSHAKYTKATFAQKMLDLAQKATGQGEAAAQASLELANGYYNMSYYGNGRDIYDTEHGNLRSNNNDALQNSELSYNLDFAKKYYIQAAQLSGDKEFKAKATWMLAKVEHNIYYNVHAFAPQDPNSEVNDINAGEYYKKLKAEFSDTQYYQEVIKECGYFKTFVDQR